MLDVTISATVLHRYSDVFDNWIVSPADVLEVDNPG
jgi:hypothetical protein